jgi:transitional endoplasmic reticulum ATPase
MPLAADVDLGSIAEQTQRYTGADLEDVVRRAGLVALRQSLATREVTMAHFEEALKDSRATVTPEMENEYEAMQGKLKQQASSIQPIGFIAPGMLEGRGPKG